MKKNQNIAQKWKFPKILKKMNLVHDFKPCFQDLRQGQICQAPPSFLLYAQSRQVSRLMIDITVPDLEGEDQVLSIKEISKANSISWDSSASRFYWVDSQKHKIYSMQEEGERRVSLLDGQITARSISIYSVGDLIFWTGYNKPEICYSHLTMDGKGNGKKCFPAQENVVPDRIAIHQQSGTILFSNNCTVQVIITRLTSTF